MKKLLLTGLLCSVVVMAGCTQKTKDVVVDELTNTGDAADTTSTKTVAAVGDTVHVDYIGSLEDGTVFDTSREDVSKENDLYNPARPYEPLTFTLGGGQMIPGFDKGVVGMKVGERKVLTIAPADAYGEKKEELIQQVPLSGFTAGGITPQVGETYTIGFAQGTVTAIEGENVTMDFNHFLAGKTLKFDVELVSID